MSSEWRRVFEIAVPVERVWEAFTNREELNVLLGPPPGETTPHEPGAGMEILDAIRDAIEASGKSRYQLARESGVAESVLSRLISGERGMSVGTVERMADALGLEIVVRPKRRRRKCR